MTQRIDYVKLAPAAIKAMRGLSQLAEGSGLELPLIELVKVRTSQLNGCAYCIDMHTKDARALGESEQRLFALAAWRETPFFSERERAALAWAEAVTLLAEEEISDELYEEVRRQLGEEELVHLTMAIIATNGWNRLAVPFRTPVGGYQSRYRAQEAQPAA